MNNRELDHFDVGAIFTRSVVFTLKLKLKLKYFGNIFILISIQTVSYLFYLLSLFNRKILSSIVLGYKVYNIKKRYLSFTQKRHLFSSECKGLYNQEEFF